MNAPRAYGTPEALTTSSQIAYGRGRVARINDISLSLAGHEIEARSVGGIETCFRIPSFDVCLDMGRCPEGAEKHGTVLLTHAHIDHAAGLPYYVSMRGLISASPPKVYCPAASHETLDQILSLWATLQADSDRCSLIGVKPRDEIPLRKQAFARVFRSPHRISTVGYTLFRRVQKLLPELAGESSHQIAERARAGQKVTSTVITPEICFPGDTRIEVVDTEPTVTTARVLLLECTFLGDRVSPETAARGGHVHLDQIAERAELFKNEAIVLTHFSRRFSHKEIKAEVEAKLPEALRARLHLLIHE